MQFFVPKIFGCEGKTLQFPAVVREFKSNPQTCRVLCILNCGGQGLVWAQPAFLCQRFLVVNAKLFSFTPLWGSLKLTHKPQLRRRVVFLWKSFLFLSSSAFDVMPTPIRQLALTCISVPKWLWRVKITRATSATYLWRANKVPVFFLSLFPLTNSCLLCPGHAWFLFFLTTNWLLLANHFPPHNQLPGPFSPTQSTCPTTPLLPGHFSPSQPIGRSLFPHTTFPTKSSFTLLFCFK